MLIYSGKNMSDKRIVIKIQKKSPTEVSAKVVYKRSTLENMPFAWMYNYSSDIHLYTICSLRISALKRFINLIKFQKSAIHKVS
ncbi:hypothetical protein ES702_02664 [subsurface metagenome]